MDIPRKLIVSALIVPYVLDFTSSNSTSGIQISGYEGKLLDLILTTLGFEYELRTPEDKQYGRKEPNGYWTGMIGMVQRGEADMAFCDISITDDRMKAVDFSKPYATDDYIFVIQKPHNIKMNLAFLYPFTASVWTCLIVSLMSIAAVYFVVYDGKHSYGYIFSGFCSSLLRQPLVVSGGKLKRRGLASTWLLFALVISNSYSATLLSFLTVPLQGRGVRNFEQLSAAVQKGTHRFFTVEGDITVQYLKRSREKYLRLLGTAIEDNGWYFKASEIFNYRSYIGPTTAAIFVRNQVELFTTLGNPQGRVFASDDTFYSLPVAIAVRKGFCCMQELNEIVSRINNGGFFHKFSREESFKFMLMHSNESFSGNKFKTISFEAISGPFLLLCIGHLLSFILCLGENVIFKLQKV